MFFYIGLVISALRLREQRYVFILLWLLTAAIPSIVTIDAPSSIRIINALPVLTIFPVIGLEVIHFLSRLSTVSSKLSPKNARLLAIIGLLALFALYITRTYWEIFRHWPDEDEVEFIWQEALTDIAGYLDDNGTIASAVIGGWTPDSMDPPTMELSLLRKDLDLRYFDPLQGLIVPSGVEGVGAVIARPSALPLDPFLEELLHRSGVEGEEMGSFTFYTVPGEIIGPEKTTDISFGGELVLFGYDILTECENDCEIITYWRVQSPNKQARRIFLHLVGQEDATVDQDDGLAAPSEHWQIGDVILQRHSLQGIQGVEEPRIRVGVYNPDTGVRLELGRGREFFEFAPQD